MNYKRSHVTPAQILCVLVLVMLPIFRYSEAYNFQTSAEQDSVLAVRSRNAMRMSPLLYRPADRIEKNTSPVSTVQKSVNRLDSKSYKKKKSRNKPVTTVRSRRVRPTVIKKTLRNENGVISYHPVKTYPHGQHGAKKRNRKWQKSHKQRTTPTRRSRKKYHKNRRPKKFKPTHKSKQRPTPNVTTKGRDVTGKSYRKQYHRPRTTKPTINKRKKYVATESSPAPVVPRSRNSYFDVTPEATAEDPHTYASQLGESPNSVGLRRLYAPQNNPYGLQAPRGFRITTPGVNSPRKRDGQPRVRNTVPRSTNVSHTSSYRPTNPSMSILQIRTTSIDDAYSVLRGIGTGFRVKLIPTSSDDIDLTTPEMDEFDIEPREDESNETISDGKNSAIKTLKALFSKFSNATAFQPRRHAIDRRHKMERSKSSKSWWQRDHVCVTESPNIYGISAEISSRLAITSQCEEEDDQYVCTERYGFGDKAPARTTTYRCCDGFQISVESKRCQTVRFLANDDVIGDSKKVASLSDESDFDLQPTQQVIQDQSQELTLFMPSDNVVNEFMTSSEFDISDKNDIELFLENHVVLGRNLSSKSLKNNQILTAMSGNSIRINFFKNNLMTVNCRQVLQRDLVNSNSMVHMIGNILQSVDGTVYDYITKNRHRFSMFQSVIDSSGLAPFLQSTGGNFTLFVPTNDAFEIHHDTPDSRSCLANILRHHMLDGILCSSSWKNSPLGTVVRSQAGEKFILKIIKGRYFVNDALTVEQDIMTTNGVIHVIDGLLQSDKGQSVLSLLKSNQESSEMLKFLELGGMKELLTSGENFTILVPSNDAFQSLPSAAASRFRRNPKEMKKFLLFHTIPFKTTDEHLSASKSLMTLDPPHRLKLTSFTVRVDTNGVQASRQTVTAVQCARLSTPKITKACNGAVMHISKVLLPPSGSVLAVLQQAPRGNFSILLRAISRSNLGEVFTKSKEITVFAPTNEAFERLPSRFVKYLFQNIRVLRSILRFHVSKGIHCCEFMQQGYEKLPTLQGSHIASCPKKNRILLGRNKNRLRAKVIRCELPATNGFIHAIDNLLLPAGFRN